MRLIFFFFFFQAEDGIRDADVTGVQTCALPILDAGCGFLVPDGDEFLFHSSAPFTEPAAFSLECTVRQSPRAGATAPSRSEERRVGKECRCSGLRSY